MLSLAPLRVGFAGSFGGVIVIKKAESKVEGVLPEGCHKTIGDSSTARASIIVQKGKLVFPKQDAGSPLHLMGHQNGAGVIEATAEQLKALLDGSAKEAGQLRIKPSTFAGAILAGGKVMGENFEDSDYRNILDQFLVGGDFKGTEGAPAIGVTLSLVEGQELIALVGQVLINYKEDLGKVDSELRLWILCACPYLAKLHTVYYDALQHEKPDEVAWTVGRLSALPDRVSQSQGTEKNTLKAWAEIFAGELDRISQVNPFIVDPVKGAQVQLSELAEKLRRSN
jgi:hypothetical protein